jgi:AraC family transcriptional regulator
MHRVLEHIDRELDQPLDLERLAAVANFSSFHFHRLFTAWMGETLGDYVRRRRLELAALRLVAQPDLPIVQVALSVGFGSPEAFARAFKARFGQTPTEWRANTRAERANSNPGQANGNPGQADGVGERNDGLTRDQAQEVIMDVKLIDRRPTFTAYLRHVGPYGPDISAFWQEKVYPWMKANDLLGRPRVGISHDDPAITAPEQCRYDAGIEVPEGFVGSGNYLTTMLPGGKYAVTRFRGREDEIGAAWASLLRDWLPQSGLQLDARPFFEYYPTDAACDPGTGIFECDICVPVATL